MKQVNGWTSPNADIYSPQAPYHRLFQDFKAMFTILHFYGLFWHTSLNNTTKLGNSYQNQ